MSLKLPSTVTDKKYLRMPSDGNVVESDEEWEKCGKWILPIPNNDLSWADNVWTDLQPLLDNGCLLLLKVSTAAFKESGVIMCFTRPGQEEAKKAAEAIREVVPNDYEYTMLYKLVKDSNEGKDRRFGDKYVSQYIYTFQGGFYARDANQRLVGEHETTRKKPVSLKSTKALKPLPSTKKMIDFDRNSEIDENSKRNFPKKGFWQFKCSLQIEEDGLSEADRVWLVVKRLYDKGSFVKITCISRIEIANIFCYVSDCSNVLNLINDCKYVIKNTHFSAMSNFYIITGINNFFLKYVLTPEQELYGEERKLNDINMVALKFVSEAELEKI